MTSKFERNFNFVSIGRGFLFLFLFSLFAGGPLHAARPRSSYEKEQSGIWNEVLSNLQMLKHGIANHEEELRVFEERFTTQEEIIESLRAQLNEALAAIKELLNSKMINLEGKIQQQENSAKGLTSNIKAFSNESTAALSEYKQRILDLEKTIASQNKNIESLQNALRSLSDALLEKGEEVVAGTNKTYQVKSGDNLEKIARQHHTSIKKLKELNALTKDQIIVGQKLQIPE